MRGLIKGCAVIASVISLGSGNVMAAEACAGEGGLTKSGTIVATAKSVGFFAGIRWAGGEVTLNNGQKLLRKPLRLDGKKTIKLFFS